VLSYARSVDEFMVDLYRRPEVVLAALDVVMADLMEDTLSRIDDSTETILIPANRFASGFISPRFFEKFAFPHFLEMVKRMAGRGITVFFHFDQDWTQVLPYFLELPPGKYVFHFDSMTDIFKAKEVLGYRMCIMGDVPARLFKLGTPRDIEGYCKKLIDIVGEGGGFILAAGCEEPDGSRFENIKTMLDTARTYRP
jgi:uroporphyrinogen-III decarboxylase